MFRPGSDEPLRIPRTSPVLQLLQRIRDEAHRFAITYHRNLRAKRTLQTELTRIPGVGPLTARKLLQVFGSVQAVRDAPMEELRAKVGAAAANKVEAWRCHPMEPLDVAPSGDNVHLEPQAPSAGEGGTDEPLDVAPSGDNVHLEPQAPSAGEGGTDEPLDVAPSGDNVHLEPQAPSAGEGAT